MKKFRYCDPKKAKSCNKTNCFKTNGPCHLTANKKYKARGIKRIAMALTFGDEGLENESEVENE